MQKQAVDLCPPHLNFFSVLCDTPQVLPRIKAVEQFAPGVGQLRLSLQALSRFWF